MAMTRVVLRDKDRIADHASGKMDTDKLGETHLVKRDGKIYGYSGMSAGAAIFRECFEPVEITEF